MTRWRGGAAMDGVESYPDFCARITRGFAQATRITSSQRLFHPVHLIGKPSAKCTANAIENRGVAGAGRQNDTGIEPLSPFLPFYLS